MQTKDFYYTSTETVCADLKIILITDEKSAETAQTGIHMHSFWELFYLRNGTLTIENEKDSFVFSKNQMAIIPPNFYHCTFFSDDAVKKSVFFTFEKVKSNDEDKLFDSVYSVFSGDKPYKVDNCDYPAILINTLLETGDHEKFAKKWRMKSASADLIFTLYDRLNNVPYLPISIPPKQNTYWVYKYAIDRLLDIYYSNDISLEFLSEKLFVSPQNITKIISAAYGKSFNELKFELKMRNARKMLSETNLSVNKIAEKAGYTSTRGFVSAFSKFEGCSPSEYRKKLTGR